MGKKKLDLEVTACWLLFCQQPTDRALAGWWPGTDLGMPDVPVSRKLFVSWVAPELTRAC